MQRTAQQQVSLTLQNVQKLQTWMQSMIQYTRWPETKPDTEKHSKDFLRDISVKRKTFEIKVISIKKGYLEIFQVSFFAVVFVSRSSY